MPVQIFELKMPGNPESLKVFKERNTSVHLLIYLKNFFRRELKSIANVLDLETL